MASHLLKQQIRDVEIVGLLFFYDMYILGAQKNLLHFLFSLVYFECSKECLIETVLLNFVCLVYGIYVPVNSYGHVEIVNLTTLFSWASLTKQLTSSMCTYFRL